MTSERVADRGLQPERTALAWQRTALAIGVNGALLCRHATVASVLVGVVTLVVALAVAWIAHRRYRGTRGRPVRGILLHTSRAAVLGTAVCVCISVGVAVVALSS
ncbi:DUF202 domain-containing protein [Saccharomonospora sp.]|uniref:DUF202 domain-containing protein n=1 Tax=Saccharomonospora sp. TaxID=33913 RepID=UPI002612F192|nr:DUF202 domain-containing protein [Saccharomonospora sp.]